MDKKMEIKVREAVEGFDSRCAAVMAALEGQPLEKKPIGLPYEPGRPRQPRGYSYAIINFAMKVYLLREERFYAEADAALAENCRLYIEDAVLRNDRDSFYWSIDILCRILAYFGEKGTMQPGLVSAQTEALCYEMMFLWVNDNSLLEDAEIETSKTWVVWESENHHIQKFSTAWQLTMLLAENPAYQNRPLSDGALPAAHCAAWTAYTKEYLRQRAQKSLFIETSNSFYGLHTLKGIYNFYDFSPDAALRRLAGNLLTLYWATWAQEQLDGVRGGGKARIYPGECSLKGTDPMRRLAWFYLGTGEMLLPTENEFTVLTSGYRLPALVAALALDDEGRGCYEIFQRPLGLAADGCYLPAPSYHADTTWGEILRYSYCTPDFILGSLIVPARRYEDWTLISSQNRWQGVIFSGHPDCRIVPQCRTVDMSDPEVQVKRAYNQHWTLQKNGTLITQKLRTSEATAGMRVWFSEAGLSVPTAEGGWLFVEAPHAFAAVKIVAGEYSLERKEPEAAGVWAVCEEEYSPVILEVAGPADFPDFGTFRAAILGNSLSWDGKTLHYISLSGDDFEMDATQHNPLRLNGEKRPHPIPQAYKSPYVNGDWNGDTVTIQKNDDRLTLDFYNKLV